MKIAFVHLCGFRGYREPTRIEFSDSFTVVDGPNGVGKSTIFDAIEFALTGTISKYLDATADRETVDDYIWWVGGGVRHSENFVEVGFRDVEDIIVIRRTPFSAPDFESIDLMEKLVDSAFAPAQSIFQLCKSTIIRDEHIARLSLDLKETDRFTLLRDAIGAVDAEDWIERARALLSTTSTRVKQSTAEVEEANRELANAIRQVDEMRNTIPATALTAEATNRLQQHLNTTASLEQLPDLARQRLGRISADVERLDVLGRVSTNGHGHVNLHGWNSRKLNTNGSRHTSRCSAATSPIRTSRFSTPSCTSPSMVANGAGYRRGSATGTPSTPG